MGIGIARMDKRKAADTVCGPCDTAESARWQFGDGQQSSWRTCTRAGRLLRAARGQWSQRAAVALGMLACAVGCGGDREVAQALQGAQRAVACDRELDDEAAGYVGCIRYQVRGSAALRTGLYFQALVTLDLAARSGLDDAGEQLPMIRALLEQAVAEQPIGMRQAVVRRFCAQRWPVDCAATAQRVGVRLQD